MSVRQEKFQCPKTGRTRTRWMVDIDLELPNGNRRRHRKVAPIQTRRGAEEYERQLRQELLFGTYEKQKHVERRTFTDFCAEFMRDHINPMNKPSEVRSKETILRLHLIPFFGSTKLNDLDDVQIKRFIKRQTELGLSPKTVNNHLILLRTILGAAYDIELIPKIPKIKKLKVMAEKIEFLTEDEIQRLYKMAHPETDWYAAIVLAINCGLRLGEIIALKKEDMDLKARKLWVQRSDWQGHLDAPKNGKSRVIPLNDTAVDAIKRCSHLKSEWLICKSDGSRYSKDHYAAALKRIRRRAGLRQFNWHLMRHTFASILVSRGTPLRVVQELLGHASITMTQRYTHMSDEDAQKAVERLMLTSGDFGDSKLTAT